ncbi:MAG TPA: helix-turn-helix domain-containing protein [Planctomycetota bacterium]|nr:helix-turn-helix domain-containing protein [Planctomycetota bacterium]
MRMITKNLPVYFTTQDVSPESEPSQEVLAAIGSGKYLPGSIDAGSTGYIRAGVWLDAALLAAELEVSPHAPPPGPVALVTARLVRRALEAWTWTFEETAELFGRLLVLREPRAARAALAAALGAPGDPETAESADSAPGGEPQPDVDAAAALAIAGLTFLDDRAPPARDDGALRAITAFGTPRAQLSAVVEDGDLELDPALRTFLADVRDRVIEDERDLARRLRDLAETRPDSTVPPSPTTTAQAVPVPPNSQPPTVDAPVPRREDDLPDLLDAQQAMKLLGVGQSTLYEWADHGRVPCVRYGRMLRFEKAALLAWRAEQGRPAKTATPTAFNWRRLRKGPRPN